jgi:hypothetical protein
LTCEVDMKLKGKCLTCMFKTDALFLPPLHPCDMCIDRPTRRNDESQYVVEFTEEEKQKMKEAERLKYEY